MKKLIIFMILAIFISTAVAETKEYTDKTSLTFSFTNISSMKLKGSPAAENLKLYGQDYQGLINYDINKYLTAGLAIGNFAVELRGASYNLNLNENYYAGIYLKSEIDLIKDFSLINRLGYTSSSKKNYGLSNININDFQIKKLSNDLYIKKEIKPVTILLGIGYTDYKIKSAGGSTANFIYDLKSKKTLSPKLAVETKIIDSLLLNLNATDKSIGAALTWKFTKLKRTARKEEQKIDNIETAVIKEKKTMEQKQPTTSKAIDQIKTSEVQYTAPIKSAYEQYRENGLAALRAKRYNEALMNFQSAKSIRPDNDEIYRLLAETYEQLGNLEEAILNYDKALSLIRSR